MNLVAPTGVSYELAAQVFPLLDENSKPLGVSVVLADVGRVATLHEDFQQMHTELETAYEELQSTNE